MVGLQASSDVPTHCSTVRWQSRHPRRRAVAMAVRVPRHNGACRTRQRAPSLPALVLAAHRTGHCMVKLGHALQQWRSCWVAAGSASTQLNTAHRLGIYSAQRRFASARTLPQLATDLLGGSRLPRSVLFSAWALHYGSHATTARAGTRTAARGRLGMYLARRRRHEGAHAPPRLALDSRLARCGTRVNVRTTPAYTRHRSTYCRLAAVLELTLVHGHARHTADSEATQFWRASGLTPAPCERRAIVRTGHVAGGALQFQTAVGSGRVT